MKKNIDIILSVIDNYGDMGMLLEILSGFHREYPDFARYRIWTDAVSVVSDFLKKNTHILPEYTVSPDTLFPGESPSEVCLTLFHRDSPEKKHFASPSLTLRIDYVSWDSTWVAYHGDEHVYSDSIHQIREFIPSPLPSGGGILASIHDAHTRMILADTYRLSGEKKWFLIFAYPETLHRIDLEALDEDVEYLIFGNVYSNKKNIHNLPILPLDIFQSFLRVSEYVLIRGEISMMNMLSLKKPFFWDMYKSLGGYPIEQSREFLRYGNFSSGYREIHTDLNETQKKIKLGSYMQILEDSMSDFENIFPMRKNMLHELKKDIDRFLFSL